MLNKNNRNKVIVKRRKGPLTVNNWKLDQVLRLCHFPLCAGCKVSGADLVINKYLVNLTHQACWPPSKKPAIYWASNKFHLL